jgi:hypothetical protein
MITKFLPKFKAVEVNDSVGLRCGHMIAQFPADAAITTVTFGNTKFIENGIFVGLGKDGTVENYDYTKHDTMFIHFTEELNTVLDELQYYALPVEQKYYNGGMVDDFASTYPRCIALYVNDAYTTNNIANINLDGAKFAKVVDGVATLQTTADEATAFIAKKTTMPNGELAYELTYYRKPTGVGTDSSNNG